MSTALHIPKVSIKDQRLILRCPYEDRELAKNIPGYKWDSAEKAWTYPVRPEVVKDIRRLFPTVSIDAEAVRAVQRIEEREQEAQRIKNSDNVPDVEMPILAKPFEHQKRAFAIGITLPNFAALMEQGCGKTLTAIAIAGHRYKYDGLRRVLVVAPTSVVTVWPKEFKQFAAFPTEVIALQGSSKEKAETLKKWPPPGDKLQVAVINYESTWRVEKELAAWIRGGMIICDESQRIKTPGATQSKCLHRIGQLAAYRMILTGTPVTQSPLDFYSQYKFLQPEIFGGSFTAFRARYAQMVPLDKSRPMQGPKKIVGYQRLDELVKKAHSIAFRVTKAEALDLPKEITQPHYIELEKDARHVYNELRKEAIAELSGGTVTAANVLTKLLRLSQVTGGFVTDENGFVHRVGSEKLKVFDELLTDLLDAGKKVVVFARFIPEIKEIGKLLEKRGIGYRVITGDVKQADRGQAVQDFQTNPEVKVFVAQIQTAGLGITLTAADTAIFYSMDFSLANHEQAKARIHRIGQKYPVTYIYLLAQGTVDEHIYDALREKKNVADLVVDRWREFMKG